MKVRELEYDHAQLDSFGPNDLYRKCHKELLVDFEKAFEHFLEMEIPDDLNDAQKAGVIGQKTGLYTAFVSGHLNAFDPTSSFFSKFSDLTGLNLEEEQSALSGLILPDHLRK